MPVLSVGRMPVIPALERLRQLQEFKASLPYLARTKLVCVIKQDRVSEKSKNVMDGEGPLRTQPELRNEQLLVAIGGREAHFFSSVAEPLGSCLHSSKSLHTHLRDCTLTCVQASLTKLNESDTQDKHMQVGRDVPGRDEEVQRE